jgi:hypothetical protein
MVVKSLGSTNFKYIIFILAIAIQIIFALQGFDFADEGYSLCFYKYFFSHPEYIKNQLPYYFSGFLGGALEYIYPNGGILYFRILTVIITLVIFTFIYYLLRKSLSGFYIILAYFLIPVIPQYGIIVLHHNLISALMVTIGIYFITKSLLSDKKSNINLIIAGFSFGLYTFSRLPNVLVFIFILAAYVFILLGINKEKTRIILKKVLHLLIGSVISCLVILIVMWANNHVLVFIDNFNSLLSTVKGKSDSDTSHSLNNLITVTWKSIKQILIGSAIVYVMLKTSHVLIKSIKINIYITLITLGLVFYLSRMLIADNIVFILSLCIYGIINNIKSTKDKILYITSVFSLIILIVNPIGSDGYFNFTPWTFYLALPLAIHGIIDDFKENKPSESPKVEIYKYYALLIYFMCWLGCFRQTLNKAYFDEGSRLYKKHVIHSNKANFIYTSKIKAEQINSILISVQRNIPMGKHVVAFNNIPMIFYLTDIKPTPLGTWISGIGPNDLNDYFIKLNKELPYFIIQKFNSIGYNSEINYEYFKDTVANEYGNALPNRRLFQWFIQKNQYGILYEDDYHLVMSPPTKKL